MGGREGGVEGLSDLAEGDGVEAEVRALDLEDADLLLDDGGGREG